MNAVGCVPRVHIINAVWQKKTDLHIAISCNAVGRGVGVSTARHRLSTQTQCTIRATAWDRESHAGYGSRKRSGVPCGSSLWRGGCGGELSSYMPQRAFCFTDEARFPWAGGVRRPNAESDVGSRPGSVVPWAIECEIRDLARDPEFHVRLRVGDRMSCGIRVPIRD